MKLICSGNSPYARRPRMAIREAGLMDKVEEVDVSPMPDNMDMILGFGPGAKVPGLVTDSGTYISETLVICHYLDDISGGKLYPKDSAAREQAMVIEGIASLLMDSQFARSHEKRREDGEMMRRRAGGADCGLLSDPASCHARAEQYVGNIAREDA